MRNFICSIIALMNCTLFAAYNEFHYQGIYPLWEKANAVSERLEIINFFLPGNPTVFEAGAFDGHESVQFAKFWPNGRIISFEPNPSRFMNYQQNAAGIPNMQGYNLAVGTYNGVAEFYLCWGSSGLEPVFEGASSLLRPSESRKIDYQGPIIQVPCVIFDDWCAKNNVPSVDFMWLDLEGFELQFLKSSPQILKTTKVIYTETNFFGFRIGTTQYDELKAFLNAQGFEEIAHWYWEGLQGDAIFVRKELL